MIEKRKTEGIPLLDAVVKDLEELGEKLKIAF